jgi:hypothetical protein
MPFAGGLVQRLEALEVETERSCDLERSIQLRE